MKLISNFVLFGTISVCGLSARAATFDCSLANNSTRSTDANFSLPQKVVATFGSDGQTVAFSNSADPSHMNSVLSYDHLEGSHLIFASQATEGISRKADILALSVQAFVMDVSGEDVGSRTWTGAYGCWLQKQ